MSLSWSWILVGSCLLLSPIKLILSLPFLTIGIRYLCEVGYLALPRSRIALAYVLLMMPSLALSTFSTLLDTTLPLQTLVSQKTILMVDTVVVLSLVIILSEWEHQV